MEDEKKKNINKNFLQKILFINPEKKWWWEPLEFGLSYMFLFSIAILISAVENKSIESAWKAFLETYWLNILIISAPIKWGFNYLTDFRKSFDDKINNDISIINKKTEDISSMVDKYLNKAKIVFESGINEFDDTHLLALHRILNNTNLKENELINEKKQVSLNIYAIDNSDPRTWWSDTMTGYLALLSNWKSLDNKENRRTVHRIFVCQKNELLSPVFIKTISLHSLMGFKTYVITHQMYRKLLEDIHRDNPGMTFKDKEVLIWTKTLTDNGFPTESPMEVSFNLDKLGRSKVWDDVKCYQSFWEIGSDYNERNDLINKKTSKLIDNFYGNKINSNDIDIWFEFIAKEKTDDTRIPEKRLKWEELPNSYILLIKNLINKMECCKDDNEVKHINAELPFGIEIKTLNCPVCKKNTNCNHSIINRNFFDFTSYTDVQKILKEYYNKLN